MKRIPLLFCLLAGSAWGADGLAPLYVDPELVPGAKPRPKAPPASPSPAPATSGPAPAPATEPAAAAPAPTPAQPAAQAVEITPVPAPAPVAAPAPGPTPAPAPSAATPAPVPAAKAAAPAAAPAARTAEPVPAPPRKTALGPLYVSPELIRGGAPATGVAGTPAAPARPGAPAGAPVPGSAPAPGTAVASRKPAPGETLVEARSMTGTQNVDIVAEGDAVLVRDDLTLRADRLTYHQLTDEAEAEGNVRVSRGPDSTVSGPRANLVVGAQTGEFESPDYSFSRSSKPAPGEKPQTVAGSGHADKLYFEGENHYRLANATWSTCPAPDPDWYLKTRELNLDYDREVGEAKGSTLVFKDVPLLYSPWADFPLANQRQSGFLSPSFGTSTKTGVDIATPYYWNLAPNYDATLTPRVMGRRGLQLGGEFRYLTSSYAGTSRAEWLPSDSVTGGARAAGSWQHQQTFLSGFSGALNLNRVSDRQYFEDLSNRIANISTANLVQEGTLTYAAGGWWNVTGRMQSYQTLSGGAPYRRLPQVVLNASRPQSFLGTALSFTGDYTQFEHPDDDKTKGSRLVLYPQLSLPIETSYFSLVPKIGVHHTRYELDQPVTVGEQTSFSRTLPIATVDGSMVFERDWSFAGRNYVQTLEPRLYYVYIPHEDQDPAQYPIFDTAYYDFNFAQIFSENIFSGQDRIANANQLTAAVTSRLIEPGTGAELVKAAIGQRYYFADQRVLLNAGDKARTGKRADIVAAFTGQVAPKTTIDTGVQYNPNEGETERFSFGLRWQPETAKALGIAWRYKRNPETADPDNPTGYRDIDITGQWPLWGRWYGVGRYNRSLLEHRTTEAIAGLEYDGGCWVLRTAVHRYVTRRDETSSSSVDNSGSNTAFFVQLEFSGLTSLGSSPVSLLRRSVPGYGMINENRPFNDDPE